MTRCERLAILAATLVGPQAPRLLALAEGDAAPRARELLGRARRERIAALAAATARARPAPASLDRILGGERLAVRSLAARIAEPGTLASEEAGPSPLLRRLVLERLWCG